MTVLEFLTTLRKSGIELQLIGDRLRINAPEGVLTPSLKDELVARKEEIVQFLKIVNDSNPLTRNIVAYPRDGHLPLSYSQQRLWLLDQIDGGSAHYNLSGALKLVGQLNYQALNRAFSTILERHESLRTYFAVDEAGQPYQIIQTVPKYAVAIQDLSQLQDNEREAAVSELVNQEAHRIFNLRSDLMLRVQLLKITESEHFLLVSMHHIASDGWSLAILTNEFSALYTAYDQGKVNPLPGLKIQYADYAHWQRNWLTGEILQQQLAYWEQKLAGLPLTHSLPLDRPRPQVQRFFGNKYKSQIDGSTGHALKALCQAQGATLFMGLHAVFSTLLSRYSNEQDIVIGSPIANREQAEVAELIGFFANTLVLRSDLSKSPGFIELLNQSKQMLLDAYAHQQVPFELVVERLQPERSLSHSPLSQIMLILQNNQQGKLELPGLTIYPIEQKHALLAKFDLTLNVREMLEGLELVWEYNTDLFNPDTIEHMASHFDRLLKSLLSMPDENVFKVDILNEAERSQILVEWNDTTAEYPKDKCVHELFERQVEHNPNAIAVVFEEQQFTYQELNIKANRMAEYLIRERQVGPDTLVGICLERSLEMVVAVLGVLKAGGAYVPLDPDYPQARLAYMLADAELTTVITHSGLLERFPIKMEQALCVDDENFQARLAAQSGKNPSVTEMGLTPQHLAYVIYTSGSTGNPKGVQAPHLSLINRLNWLERQMPASADDVFCQKTAFGFVDHAAEIFQALAYGCPLIVVRTNDILDPNRFAYIIARHHITRLTVVPSLLKHLIENNILAKMTSLRLVISSGEALQMEEAQNFHKALPEARLLNLYGSSEVGADVTAYWIEKLDKLNTIPIGRPIDNIQLLVCNPQLQLTPQGIPGELLIGGAGLARGYLSRPELTAEKFIPNPYYDRTDPKSSERLYKTGDLVRRLPDGNLEYLGRKDHQIKIRGFRIELGEIENTLSGSEDVKDAVVVVRESLGGDKQLVAYVVAEQQKDSSLVEVLRQYLEQRLPEYMVPSAYVVMDKLPLTPNGKVDRRALPAPDPSQQRSNYVAPRTELEKGLCEIWQDVLRLERVGVTDNFFHLGGHSLMAVHLFTRINQTFNVNLPLATLFHGATIEHLANVINNKAGSPAWSSVIGIKTQGHHPPFFCIHGVTGDILWFRELANYLAPEYPFYGLQARGLDGVQEPVSDIEEMAGYYIEEIRNYQPTGPYYLGGASFGGTVALEIAQRLIEQGDEVALLAVFDHSPPNIKLDVDQKSLRYRLDMSQRIMRNFPYWLKDFMQLGPSRIWMRIRRKLRLMGKTRGQAGNGRLAEFDAMDIIDFASELPAYRQKLITVHYQAIRKYSPERYPGQVTLFRAKSRSLLNPNDPELGWLKLAPGRVTVIDIPSSHEGMFKEPYVQLMAEKLKMYM